MAAKKKKKAAKKAPSKKAKKAKKGKKTARKAAKKVAKKSKKKTVKAARKAAPRKAAKKPALKKAAKPAKKAKKKQIVGEGDYQASRAFLKDQSGFVKKNKDKIPELGKEAEAALEGPQGDALREAEATAAARSRDLF